MEFYMNKENYNFDKCFYLKYGILDKRIIPDIKISKVLPTPIDYGLTTKEYQETALNMVSNELNLTLEKLLTTKIFENIKEDYVNILDRKNISNFEYYLYTNKFDFIIVSPSIYTDIYTDMNIPSCRISPIGYGMSNDGSINGVDICIDPYKKWNDKSILCGRRNSFFYNIEIFTIENNPNFGFQNKINLTFLYNINIVDRFTNLYYINEKDYAYDKFKNEIIRENREEKLNDLLY